MLISTPYKIKSKPTPQNLKHHKTNSCANSPSIYPSTMKILMISLSWPFLLLLLLFLLPTIPQSSAAMQNPPISKDSSTDVKDLAHSALELALAKANQTLVHVGELFKNTTDPVLYRYYGTCIDEYQGTVTRHLPGAISALESNNYETSKQEAGSAATSADTCEQQFVPEKSPMFDENAVVHGLSVVASNIVELLG